MAEIKIKNISNIFKKDDVSIDINVKTERDSLLDKASGAFNDDSPAVVKYCALFCAFGIVVLNLAAFIAACVEIDVECNDNLNIHAASVLITGVLLTAICAIIDCVFGIVIGKDNNICLGIVNIIYLLIIFILCCYSFTVYNEMDVDCKMTSLGQVLLAWSLIYFLVDTGLCCCGCCLLLGSASG